MIWTQRGWWHPTYQLWDGQTMLGEQQSTSPWKPETVARLRDRTLAFRAPKWWSTDYIAVDNETQQTVATYEGSAWRCKTTIHVDERSYTYKSALLKSGVSISDEAGKPLFTIDSLDWLGRRYEVALRGGVEFDETIEVLVHFAWFIYATARSTAADASSTVMVTA